MTIEELQTFSDTMPELRYMTEKIVDYLEGAAAAIKSTIPVINVITYSAVGDGTADDTAALQAALTAAKTAGGGIVYLPKGTYLLKKPLVLASGVHLKGAGIGLTIITKPATIKSLLTVNAAADDTSVTVADSTGFVVGGAIHLYDTTTYEWISTQGRITGVSGNVITFTDDSATPGLDGSLQTSRTAAATTSFPLIRNELASVNISVSDLTLNQNRNSNDPANDFTISTIHWVETYFSIVDNVEILNAVSDAYSDQAQDGTSIGTPSAALIKTTKNTIRNSKIRNAQRHGVHLGTCMNGAFILNNEITSCLGYAVFYCAFATYTVADGNLVENCNFGFAGIDHRDYGNVISNNIIRQTTVAGYAIDAGSSGYDGTGGKLVITGNSISGAAGVSGCIWVEQPDCVISNNVVDMKLSGNPGIKLGTFADRSIVQGNIVLNGGTGSSQLFLDNCDDVRIIGNILKTGYKGVDLRGCNRMVALGNHLSAMSTNIGWHFQVTASTDCSIKDGANVLTTPVLEAVATVRLVYEGLGNNGAVNPATGGDWNITVGTAANRKYDGVMVYWNDGTARISTFKQAVGWIQLT